MNPVDSFTEFAERHRTEILHYLLRMLGNEPDAQDACQDVFLRAQRAFARLRPGSNGRAWLYRIATNTALTATRRRSRAAARQTDIDVDGLANEPDASPNQRVLLRELARALQALPPRQRSALFLRQFQDLSYGEIAATLGGNEAAARANVYQAIKKLRRTVGGKP